MAAVAQTSQDGSQSKAEGDSQEAISVLLVVNERRELVAAEEVQTALGTVEVQMVLQRLIQEQQLKKDAGGPQRIRIADPELVEALSENPWPCQISCAPTPELDPFIQALQIQGLRNYRGPDKVSYRLFGASDEQIISFLKAVDLLHKTAPWNTQLGSTLSLNFSAPALGLERSAILFSQIKREHDKERSFVIFEKSSDILALKSGQVDSSPIWFLTFKQKGELPQVLREEIRNEQWPMRKSSVIPVLQKQRGVSGNLTFDPHDLWIVESIALAFVKSLLSGNSPDLPTPFQTSGDPDQVTVPTSRGPIDVHFR